LKRHGFSLVELLTVLTLVSLIMLVATVRRNQSYHAARFQSVIERLIDADMKVRRHALANNRPCRLRLDMANNLIQASRWVDGNEKFVGFGLGSDAELKSVQTVSNEINKDSHDILFNHVGASPTYSIQVQHADKNKWIVFAGRTGQPTIHDRTQEMEQLFKTLRQ